MSFTSNKYLTVNEAAELLRVSVSTVRRWIREGALTAHRVGRRRILLSWGDVMGSIHVLDSGARSVANVRPAGARAAHARPNDLDDDEADVDLGPLASLIERSPDRPVHRRLTPEEVDQRWAALRRAEANRAELLAQNGGRLFPSSVEIIHEMREERTRQLMGEDEPGSPPTI